MNIEQVARICHETNRAYCASIGDTSQMAWESAEQWQRESAIKGVQFKIDNPNAGPEVQHHAWSADKLKDGWTYGKVKDASLKTHPCLVAYDQLPVEQRLKDYLFIGVVSAFLQCQKP
jgi:hypothetical protein